MAVVNWLDKQPRSSIWITSITVLEIQFGLQILPDGKRKRKLFDSFEALMQEINQRIAPFDAVAAERAGDLMAQRQKTGRPVELRDTMIAGIVTSHRASLATRNTSHFEDLALPVINPWVL